MEVPPQAPIDPSGLARLVLHCREFRAYVDELKNSMPPRAVARFLYLQLDEQTADLKRSLDALGVEADESEEAKDEGRGFFRRMLGRSADEKTREQDGAPDLQGNSWTIPVSELVGFLSNTRKTGVLSVNTRDENFVVEIRKGDLIRATSDRTPTGLRVGELLVQQGALENKALPKLVKAAKDEGISLGEYIVTHEHVTEAQLKTALATQAEGLFYRLMSGENAVYRFQEGVDIEGAKELGMSVTHLLLEGARHKDEEGEVKDAGFTSKELDVNELSCLDEPFAGQGDAA